MSVKDVPESFDIDSEEDLRLVATAYFSELGFDRNEFSCEDSFTIRLGHNVQSITWLKGAPRDPVTGRSDIWLTHNGRSIAIVETKHPDHKLTDDDAWQGISYARLLKDIAPFVILTNGKDTRIYNTLAPELEQVDDAALSQWNKSGQVSPTVEDDIKYLAAQKLIGLNPRTLRTFCQGQIDEVLADIRGTVAEHRVYIPDVFVERQELTYHFDEWLLTDLPIFGVIGEAGVGKTNFLANTAETYVQDEFALFYHALRLPEEGLLARIVQDFEWEFHRERSVAYVVDRFQSIAHAHAKTFVIFIDGLDEFTGNPEILKTELLDLSYRLAGKSIRLCISCKGYDWEDFVIDHGRSYNRIAKSTYPALLEVSQPDPTSTLTHTKVGVWLDVFTEDELDAAFAKYQPTFSITGDLQGNAREQCHSPWLLRLAADVYRHQPQGFPSELSSRELFESYLRQWLPKKSRNAMERILAEVARQTITSGRRQVLKGDVADQLTWMVENEAAFNHLVRVGIISITNDSGVELLGFNSDQLCSHVYVTLAEAWSSRPPVELAKTISILCETSAGFEAVSYYLLSIDQGNRALLRELALLDLPLFVQVLDALKRRIHRGMKWWSEDKYEAYLEQLVLTYSAISREYFPRLVQRVEPYQGGDVGSLIVGNGHMFRIRTPEHPEAVLKLTAEQESEFKRPEQRAALLGKLQAGRARQWSQTYHNWKFPQEAAWEKLRKPLSGIITARMLDETSAPALLNERAWNLLNEPPIRIGGYPQIGPLWQELGFESLDVLLSTSPQELIEPLNELLRQLLSKAETIDPQGSRLYETVFRDTLRFRYVIEKLAASKLSLERPAFELNEYFSYLTSRNIASATNQIDVLLPTILASYRVLMESNLQGASRFFAFHELQNASILVQVCRDPVSEYMHSDYLAVCYALLPTAKLPRGSLVCSYEGQDSLAKLPTTRWVLGDEHTTWGGRFGRAKISLNIGDIHIEESNAYLSIARYPSHHPVLDQVYQLIGNEAAYLFDGDLGEWQGVEFGSAENTARDNWIFQQPFGR